MASSLRLFQTYPARSAFGENNKVQDARDYILAKSTKTKFCNAKYCDVLKRASVATQGDLLLLRNSKKLNSTFISDRIPSLYFNKSNLNVNLVTKLDLKDVKVVTNNLTGLTPTPIILNQSCNCVPYYNNYNIDPDGVLFGNTICGINNYQNFLVYNPPYITNKENHIDSL
jgi:hypothetical protein